MEALKLLGTMVPFAVSSGLNLYATVLVAGLAIKYHWIPGTPPALDVLNSWPVIIVAGIMFLIEALADKIQFVDNLWDIIHTIVRPLGSAFIALLVFGPKSDPIVTIIAVLLSGSITFMVHGGKAGSRAALNVMSPAENISNIAISTTEDGGAIGLTLLAMRYPIPATIISLSLLIIIIIFLPRLIRWTIFSVRALIVGIKAFTLRVMQEHPRSDSLPRDFSKLLNNRTPGLTSICRVQGLKKADGKTGYLSLFEDLLVFFYKDKDKAKTFWLKIADIINHNYKHRMLMDILLIEYRDKNNKPRNIRFVFLKDRSTLAEELINHLQTPGFMPPVPPPLFS